MLYALPNNKSVPEAVAKLSLESTNSNPCQLCCKGMPEKPFRLRSNCVLIGPSNEAS